MASPRMEKDKNNINQIILNLTLETIYLLSGENYEVIKRPDDELASLGSRKESPTTKIPHSKKQERNDKKILELTNQVIHTLTGEVWKFLGERTLITDHTEKEDYQSQGIAHDGPPSREGSDLIDTDPSVPQDGTQNTSTKTNSSEEEHFVDLDSYKLTHVKMEDLSFEEHLHHCDSHIPVQNTPPQSQVKELFHKEGHLHHGDSSIPVQNTPPQSQVEELFHKEGHLHHGDSSIPVPHTSPQSQVEELFHKEGHLYHGDSSIPVPHTSPQSQVEELFHEEGHSDESDLYSPEEGAQHTCFIIKDEHLSSEEENDNVPHPNKTRDMTSVLSDGSTSENVAKNVASSLSYFSSLPKKESPPTEMDSAADLNLSGTFGVGERSTETHTGHGKQMMILRRGKTFFCSVCGKSSNWKSVLVHHQRTHSEEKPFSCFVCGKCFNSKYHLTLHHRTHTGEKPFSCSECGKSFNCSSHLATHQRVHTGEKPYCCSECGKSFISTSNLIRHQKFHTGDKPYSCPDCGKSYYYKSYLARHQRRQPSGKPYSCLQCGMFYFSKCALAVHLQSHETAAQQQEDP
ncbi:gastrula zinc finger protein XlCGF53.1-like [Hyperolius riggenbachi]|uniref:gastrula zinc finger protein XlCGF53.1-like n=1 Tax=Hyperolius riggenbachi TaxID=752182 RepID=UPI0035A39CB9